MKRAKSVKIANKLQKMLGNKYDVKFDDCESGITRVFYICKNGQKIFVNEIENNKLSECIAINDFTLSKNQILELIAKNNL